MKTILKEVQARALAEVQTQADTDALALVMAHVAINAPHAVRLTAQMLGTQPCPRCDYIMQHCRCEKEFNNHGIDI